MAHRRPITIGHYYPKTIVRNASGKAIFIRELAAALTEFAETVVYSGTDDRREPPPVEKTMAIPIADTRLTTALEHLVPLLGTDDLLSLRMLATGIRTGLIEHINSTVDVLITHYYLDDIVLSHLVDVPTVYQYHGFSEVGIGGTARERLTDTDIHLANSRATATDVLAAFGREVDHIVTPGVDIDRFSPDAEPAFDSSDTIVTFVGRLAEAKGVFDLVAAFQGVSDDAHLCLIGDGAGPQGQAIEDKLSRQLRKRRLEDDVTWVGEIPHDDLHRYYAASDIICYPTYYDGFGLVNIEAMACGKPVITTRVDGVEAYATHGENSLLVEPGARADLRTAIQRLVSSPELRERLGAAGRTVAAEYSWHQQAESLADFCTTIGAETRVQ